jgi:hypothetical protein
MSESTHLKTCPNRKCRNDRVVVASRRVDASGLSLAHGECPECGTRGPTAAGPTQASADAAARRLWDALPRDEPAADAREGEAMRLLRAFAASGPWREDYTGETHCSHCGAHGRGSSIKHADDCHWAAAVRFVAAAGRADA